MTPTDFPQATNNFGAPDDLDASQVATIRAYLGTIEGGNLDGENVVVTAWKPTPEELAALNSGGLVYLSFVGGLPPHYACTDFHTAAMRPPPSSPNA